MRTLRFLLLTLAAAYAATASTVYNVQVDTSGLPSGAYYMDFQFIGSNGNTVNLTNFSYGGGTGPAGPFELDTIANVFNELTQQFTAGSVLSFDVAATNIAPPVGGFPDELSFFLLDSSQNVLPTSDTTADAFLYLDLTGSQANIQTFSGSGVNEPVVSSSDTPEPATLPMLAVGLGLVVLSGARSLRREH
jgi:hypothetical protein